MTKRSRSGLAGLLLTLALAAPASAAVSVRVEGKDATLLPRTSVADPDAAAGATGCPAGTAANALDVATGGNWDRQAFAQTILGETHAFTDSDFWNVWVFRNGHFVSGNGLCTEPLAAGEDLLVAYQQSGPAPDYAPRFLPLWVQGAPATVAPGVPFTVTVQQAACETAACLPGEGHAVARSGATVTAGAATATSAADGKATLALTQRGPTGVRATATGGTPSATEPVCVTDGADGYCGTRAPDGSQQPGRPAPPACWTTGDDGRCGTPDRTAPAARITGLREGATYRRSRAPRRVRATVAADPSGLHAVKLGLSRSHRGRCWTLSGKRAAFRRARCGHHANFTVGTSATVDYLLPGRLKPGRYVLDVVAIDGALNRDALERGRSRVVFRVS